MTEVASWFPGAGYRENSAGSLTNVGSNANYWSTSPNASGSANAGNLNFNSSNGLNPVNNNNRVNGFSVRCVSELIIEIDTIYFFSYVWMPDCFSMRIRKRIGILYHDGIVCHYLPMYVVQ